MANIQERRTKAGQKRYQVIVRRKGHPPQVATFKRRTDAVRWAAQTEAAILEGRHFTKTAAKTHTLADAIDRYLSEVVPVRHSAPLADRAIRTHLLWWKNRLGHCLLSELKPDKIASHRDLLARTPAKRPKKKAETVKKPAPKSSATVNRYLASLSVVLTTVVREWEWLDQNPVAQVSRLKEARGRVRFLSDEERPRLLKACEKSACDYLYPIVIIALSTGARYGEILHLRWRDIDLDRGVARLEKTKNQERRALPLTHLALEQVKLLYSSHKTRPSSDAYVFARADGQAPMEIRKHWYAAVEKAGIEDFRFHDLRHSAASYLAMNGATLAEIAEVLGHKTLQMVKRYAHLSDQLT